MNTLRRLLSSSKPSGVPVSPHRGLVEHLVRKGALRRTRSIRVLQKVDRAFFCPPGTPSSTIYKARRLLLPQPLRAAGDGCCGLL